MKHRLNNIISAIAVLSSIAVSFGFSAAVAQTAPKPLYRDPIFDAPTDPIIIYNHELKHYEMFYTQRRAGIPQKNDKDVSWVHGTKIGLAVSKNMADWQYYGTLNLPKECAAITQWAPDVFYENGIYHMFLTNVPGVFENWNAGRYITHLTSQNLRDWECDGRLDLGSDRVIDASVIKMPNGNYDLFYKDENQNSRLFRATSKDLKTWHPKDRITETAGEGAKAFKFKNQYWIIYDSWKGLVILNSRDGREYKQLQNPILADAGTFATDRAKGQHPDVVIKNGRAFLLYFVSQSGEDTAKSDPKYAQKSVIQIAELKYTNRNNVPTLVVNRNQNANLNGIFKVSGAANQKYNMRMPDMELHDPFVIADKETKTYYLYTSNIPHLSGQDVKGIMVYKSRDLLNWSKPQVIFRFPEKFWANDGAWAPEVHKVNGKYNLLVTVHNEGLRLPEKGALKPYKRATIRAVSDTPDGEYLIADDAKPIANANYMSLDGTYFKDKNQKEYYVYSREWLDTEDGEIRAFETDGNFDQKGDDFLLFKGSESKEATPQIQPNGLKAIVTDGPQFYRTKTGTLYMLWSSWGHDGYIQTIARSKSGYINGPWEQLPRLLGQDSGHGMIFEAFDGRKMLIVHRPFKNARGKIYQILEDGDNLVLGEELTGAELTGAKLIGK